MLELIGIEVATTIGNGAMKFRYDGTWVISDHSWPAPCAVVLLKKSSLEVPITRIDYELYY